MAAFEITYDLRKAGQNYDGLIAKLKTYPKHFHAQQSLWIVVSAKSASQIRDELIAYLDCNDLLIVSRMSGEAAWHGYSGDVNRWLKDVIEGRLAA